MKLGFALCVAVVTLLVAGTPRAIAHDFPPPGVSVVISNLTPNGHPDIRTEIDMPTGPGFDMLQVDGPDGSSIATDADIPDGTIVGRLDAETTTNAITPPQCDLHVEFSVPLVEATTDTASPDYPAYLNELAPGRHQIRFVADVSPSPDIPIFINYLSDVEVRAGSVVNDPAVGHVATRVIVGNPLDPPQQFRSCTPQRSINTVFGRTPDGTPLLFAGPTPFDQPLPFTFDFTSREDENGERHTKRVEVVAQTISPPDDAGDGIAPAPTNLRITRAADGRVLLSWDYGVSDGSFSVSIVRDGVSPPASFNVFASLSTEVYAALLPSCPSDEVVTFRVQRVTVQQAEPAEISMNPCDAPRAGVIGGPDAGHGRAHTAPTFAHALALMLVGGLALTMGIARRRTGHRL